MSLRQNLDQPGSPQRSSGSVLRVLFWVLVITFYLLGGLSLMVRNWFDLGTTGPGRETRAVVSTTAPTLVETPETTSIAATAPPTPHPTLTPRRTLYPTLTPRPRQ